MMVRELMSSDVQACRESDSLAKAAKIMWDCDCGIVPVVNEQRNVIGVLTDRDICIAAATRDATPSSVLVRDVMSRDISVCSEQDELRDVMEALKERRVRRLPVVDRNNRLTGIISMNDLVARVSSRRDAEVPGEQFLETLKTISAHSQVAVPA